MRLVPISNELRECPTCRDKFTPTDRRQKYCGTKCKLNAPSKAERTRQFQMRRREFINQYKLNVGCEECGYAEHPAALHFNHVRGEKLFNISQDPKVAITKLLEEMAKCEVLCANCHAVHTYVNHHGHTKRKPKVAA